MVGVGAALKAASWRRLVGHLHSEGSKFVWTAPRIVLCKFSGRRASCPLQVIGGRESAGLLKAVDVQPMLVQGGQKQDED